MYNRKGAEERYRDWLRRFAKFSARAFAPDEDSSAFSFDQAYSHLRGDHEKEPWLYDVPPEIFRNAMYQRKQAWSNHWSDPQKVGRPTNRRKGENESILLTKELFEFKNTGVIHIAGRGNRVVGDVRFHQHRSFGKPKSVTVSHESDGRWWLSFSFEDGVDTQKAQVATMKSLPSMSDHAIAESISGHDLGVVRAVTCSDGKVLAFTERKLGRIDRSKRRIRLLQRKLARQVKGSGKRRKTKRRIARTHSKIGDLRRDHAHQVSCVLAKQPSKILAFERLNLRGMTKRAKPVLDLDTGAFVPNGAAAKSGLNSAILNQALGMIVLFTSYKAARAGKMVVHVPAANSSRECSGCHHTSADNRQTQAQFHCIACGLTLNADDNASTIIKQRASALLLSVLGRSTIQSPEEAAKTLGLSETLLRAVYDPGSIPLSGGSTHLAA